MNGRFTSIGGPWCPLSNSRATVMSPASVGSSRWPMPGGSTQDVVRSSYSHADTRWPRLSLTVWWSGAETCSATNTSPMATSGPVVGEPPCTAPITRPVVTAKTGGSTARSPTSAHQDAASGRPARGRFAKNCHSCRPRTCTRHTLGPGSDGSDQPLHHDPREVALQHPVATGGGDGRGEHATVGEHLQHRAVHHEVHPLAGPRELVSRHDDRLLGRLGA